ncbi:MAG: hypothetical protein GX605_13980 [Chloroflexi bacterium]|nr:hypothetical protein [Chloroflexota bacterium]
MDASPFRFVLTDGQLAVSRGGREWQRLPLAELPVAFLEWQTRSRLSLFQRLEQGESAGPGFAPHLPTLATLSPETLHPVNLVAKGMGLLPRPAHLETVTAAMEQAAQETAHLPWGQGRRQRLAAARRFYDSPEGIDRRCLGGLEIFETGTFRNLQACPAASLLYVGPGPHYLSFQFNGLVQFVAHGDPRFRFLRAVRGLFEHDPFHFQQPDYPWAYLFWVTEVKDKSLKLRREESR